MLNEMAPIQTCIQFSFLRRLCNVDPMVNLFDIDFWNIIEIMFHTRGDFLWNTPKLVFCCSAHNEASTKREKRVEKPNCWQTVINESHRNIFLVRSKSCVKLVKYWVADCQHFNSAVGKYLWMLRRGWRSRTPRGIMKCQKMHSILTCASSSVPGFFRYPSSSAIMPFPVSYEYLYDPSTFCSCSCL